MAANNDVEVSRSSSLSMELRYQSEPGSEASAVALSHPPSWWKDVVVYQVWPASFKDSNGDGLGDIRGIISKLDYLKELGVDAIWLSPMYDSPQEDMGYDISDYNKIYPPYGTMDDMDELIAGLHNRGMRIVLDLVVNHTSSEHKWFQESKKSRTGKYADFYMWHDGKRADDGSRLPPNNWGSMFGGSAWEWVEERQQYYLHIFAKGQPDLNWENKEVRKAIHESALRFWLKKGVDGFRVDTCNIYSKDPELRDGPITPDRAPFGDANHGIVNGPRIHEYWQEIRRDVLNDFGDPLMVGELALSSFKKTLEFIGREPRELSMVFDFTYTTLGGLHSQPWHATHPFTLPAAKSAMARAQSYITQPLAWASVFKENHDLPRSVPRFGSKNPAYQAAAAKLLAMMSATLSGTLYIYQGEEIGMTNIPESWGIEDCRDINSINYWRRMEEECGGDEEVMRKVWKGIVDSSRENARTPVQWTGKVNGGFTTGTPWMRVNENYATINVARQQGDKDSVLGFWKRLLRLRRENRDVFVHGSYRVHDLENERTWTFEKRGRHGRRAWVLLNFSEEEQLVDLPGEGKGRVLVSNLAEGDGEEDRDDDLVSGGGKVRLRPFEGRVYLDA